jgi:hypothetical protein
MRPKISAILSQTQATFSATKSENTPKIPKIKTVLNNHEDSKHLGKKP